MPTSQKKMMQALYGHDVWENFVPIPTTDAPEGWNGNHPSLKTLASMATGSNTVVDVGTFKGQSSITMAQELKRREIDGCVICVDTFLGSVEHWDRRRNLFQRKHGMPDLFWTFMSNVWKAGVQDYVIPLPQTSVTAAAILRHLKITASLIHVDAAHEYEEVLRDLRGYWAVLEVGGCLIGDDYHPTWKGVVRAAGQFSADNALAMNVEHGKFYFRKSA